MLANRLNSEGCSGLKLSEEAILNNLTDPLELQVSLNSDMDYLPRKPESVYDGISVCKTWATMR